MFYFKTKMHIFHSFCLFYTISFYKLTHQTADMVTVYCRSRPSGTIPPDVM